MDENNPIEGLDPSQSAFEPLMDQTMPEGVQGMRTTTTTTMYISGDENAIENQRLQQTTTQPVDDPYGIIAAVKVFRQKQSESGKTPSVGDIKKLFPEATPSERIQIGNLYPDLFKEDLVYNKKAYDIYQKGIEEGKSSLQILEELTSPDIQFGSEAGLIARFPDLFNKKKIEYDKKQKEKYIAIADIRSKSKSKEIEDKQQEIKGFKDALNSGVDLFGNKLSFDLRRQYTDQLAKLEGDVEYLDKQAKESDYKTKTPIYNLGREIAKDIEPLTEEDLNQIANKLDPEYITPILKNDEEKSVFDMTNTLVGSTGGIQISDDDFIEVYKKGNYNPEQHSQYDQKLTEIINGFISKEIPIDIHKSFYERNNISKSDIMIRNEMMIKNIPNLNLNKIYSEEEMQELERQAQQNLLKNYGSVEFEELKRILGDNIRPQDIYNSNIKESNKTVSKLNNAIVVGDEDATVRNLQNLFPKSEGGVFRFSTRTDGKDSVIIRTFLEGELFNSIEVNLAEENEPLIKIRKFMSEALPAANVQEKMMELNRGEGEFVNEDGSINKIKLSLYTTKYPEMFGDVASMSADDLGAQWKKSPVMIDQADVRRNVRYQMSLVNDYTAKGREDVDLNQLDLLDRQAAIADAIEQEKQKQKGGGVAGTVMHAYLGGVSGIVEFVDDRITDVQAAFGYIPGLDEKYKNELLKEGVSTEDILRIEKAYVKEKTESDIKKIMTSFSGETQQSIQEQGILIEALSAAVESLTTMSVGLGAKIATIFAFGLRSQSALENELKDTELSDIEKFAITLPMAILEGVLEEFGLQKAIKPGLSRTRKMILSKALKDIPKDASPEAIRQSIKRAITELSGGTIEKISRAGVAESLTEIGQTGAEINLKTLVNEISGKELFQDVPNMFTPDGFIEGSKQVLKAGVLGGISGAGINVMTSTASSLVNGFNKDKNNVSIDEAFNLVTSDARRELLFDRIDIRVLANEITESDAQTIKDNINNAYPLMVQIPASFDQNQKEEAYNLLLEKKDLEQQVEGKNNSLVAKQTERLKEIDRQLELISKGGFKNAVQESETKNEVLPAEGPEVGLQEVDLQKVTITRQKNEVQKEISPETSSNYANLTEDDEGNVVIYHIGPSPENMDKDSDGDVVIKPTSGKTKATSREESSALSKVGGLADFYTQESDEESMVTGDAKYAVKVPKSKVYDFNSDPEGFIEEARRRHEKEYPGMAFDANTQLAYVSQVASENGYDVVVSEWDGRTRAQSVKELKVSDTKIKEGNRVTKEFDNTYKSNKDKGYESVIPADKDDQLEDVYMKIKNEKGDNKEYDKTYFLFDSRSRKKNYNQEQITKMVNESNVSQEIKDEYNAIMEAKPEQRRSEKVRDNIAGVDIKYPTAQEEQQRKEERTKPEYVDDAANKNQTEDVESFQKELEGEFGMLTGENPLGKPLTEQENQQLNQKAEEWLNNKGYKPRKVTGKYGQAENSFFVPGLTKEDAIAFAKEFNQESVAHSDGMIFQDGTMNPRVKSNDNFAMDEYTPESDMVSVIKTEDGLKTFSVGYDFESVTEATPKPKPKKSPAKKMKQRVDRIMKQVDNAKKAISKIIPDVEIITHKDEASYRKATGETDSKEQTSRGEYNPKTKKIHINLSRANNRTVAHEVFHAILLDKVKTNKATRDLTERMIKSLLKSDQLENIKITYRGEEITLAEYLEKFASNYDENIQSEEKLAELVGILAENYGQLTKTNKSLIKRFLDRLAKMFGLKPFTDNEVVDVLNTIAGKVAVGEEVSDVDVKVLSQGASTFVAEPTTIQPKKQIGKKVVASNKPAELSFVTKNDLIDIESLVKEIADKKQKVWFWVADQMGRGMYSDVVVDGQHFLDAGPSYALDPVNKSKDIIWATGKDKSEIEKLIGQSDFIFIISGSPISSKLFNKKNIDILEKRIGDYSKFKNDLLKSKPTKPIRDILNKHNSWNSLKESPDRKKLLLAFENQKDKNTETKNVLSKYNAFIDFNSLRDGFYRENDFKMNEVMLVLKPTAYGGKSNHSTYENDILGEVIGVPDAKVDSFDLMPEAVRKKYSETLGAAQKTQIVAPYGVGVREIESQAKRKQIVIGENADLKQNVKDFLLQANDMEAQGESREDIRIATGWERGADNKWGYELSDFIDIDLDNIQTNKLYNIEDIVTYPEIFEAYNDAKKLKIRFIDSPRKSGMAAYYAKKGLIEVNLSKINLSEYVEENMIKSKLAQNPEVLAAATREANALIKQSELEKRGVKRNSLEWNTEMQSVYPDVQNLIDRKTINDYRNKNNVSYSDFFKDVRMIERSILNKSEIDLDKGKDELNSKVLHELQHAIADLAGFPRGGSPSNIQLTFTEQEKKEYNEIVKEVARISKLVNDGKIDYNKYVEVKTKELEYRYRKYNELAGEAMSINAERRRELSPKQRREKTLQSTMDVDIQDQKLLYEEEKNIAIKEKKVEDKKKPEERRGIFDMFKKRKQKGDANMEEAIQRALMKFELSAERGNTRSQAIKSAIADLRKNDWYKSATDIQRDEAVRDIKENFGIKSKKGPSTRKVLGQQKRTKITVTLDQMAEYKKQIKEWNRSARLAKKDLNTRRKELGALVKSMVKGGIMTSKQAAILVERASKINLENEVIVNRFVEYAQKVFENAEYAQKFQEAISLRRKIKKNLRRDNQAEVISMGKKFADIDPQMVEDIDAYIEYADQMYEALRASRIKGLEVDFSQAANLAEMSDFYDEAIANQNKILKKEMIAKYQDLGLTEDMSIEEIREIVNAIEGNEVVEGKEKEIMSFIQKRFGVMTAIAKDMIGRGVNPFTGESIDITEHQKDMIKRMIKADISKMDIKNAIKFVEYMDNFITNEITSGLESAISIYEGEMSIIELMKSKVRGRMPKLGFSEGIGELWNRQLTSLPLLFDRIFQGTNRGLKVMQKIGVQEIINGKSKKTSAHNKIMQEYSKKFIDGDKSFMNAENVYERGMVAFMSRNIVGTQAEQKVEFERRKKLVAESIDTLEKSKNKKERNKAKVYREVYNRLGIMTATDIASIKSKSSAKNLASVNWWTDQWADKYSDLADVSLSVYNTILGTDTNYTPDKYKVLSKRTDISRREVEEAANKTGAFMSGTHIDRNKSGVLMETTRPGALPEGRYVSFDFDIDNFNSMDKALTDIYTASAIQKFYGASQSSDFDEVFGDTAGLIRDRVASYIKKIKGRDEFTGNKEFNKVLNTVAKFGVSKALGGVSAALKQTFPVMANTLVNAGRFDFAQREDLAWVNGSMMSIANRGLEAETAIDSADSKIDVNTSDTLRSIGKKIDSLQGMYLKAFLQAPDVYVAKSSFISYYKQYMKRKGLSTELNQGEYNQDALEYAMMWVDRQQNVSDNDLAGEFLSGSRHSMTRKVVASFASFVINQKARMMADLRVLNPANKAVTNEDRKAAARSLTGLMVELTIFHTMSAAIREAFKMAAKGLFGDDDDDDKEEDKLGSLESNKKIWSAGKYAMSSVIKDILSPFPTGGDIVVDAGTNYLIDLFDINLADEDDVQKAVDAENEIRLLNREDPMSKKEISELRKSIMEQGEIKVWEDKAFLKDLGVLSIGVNTVRDLDDAYNFYKDGYYVDDKEKKRYILDRDKEDLGFVVFGKLLTAIGLAPKDIGDISRYGLKEFKNKTITEKKYEKYTEIKKEIKREPTDGELYLILNSGQDVKNVVSDIEMLKKHFGGLTEKEAKEYLKLKDYKLSPSKFKIEEIKKGKTAEQIKKERRDRIEKTGDPVMRF